MSLTPEVHPDEVLDDRDTPPIQDEDCPPDPESSVGVHRDQEERTTDLDASESGEFGFSTEQDTPDSLLDSDTKPRSSGVLRLSGTEPKALLPDDDNLGLDEYLRQTPQAALPTIEATHKLVGGALAAVLDGRLRRFEGAWMKWTGTGWEETSDAEVRTLVRSLIGRSDSDSGQNRLVIPYTHKKIDKATRQSLVDSGEAVDDILTNTLRDALTGAAINSVPMPADQWAETVLNGRYVAEEMSGRPSVVMRGSFDGDAYEINAQGVLINLSAEMLTIEPRHATRHDMVSRSLGTSFDPTVTCPHWLKFIDDVTGGDEGLAEYLQQAAGLTLIGEIREQLFFVLYGTLGNNGKSKFIETLAKVFGDYATTFPLTLIEETKYEGHTTDKLVLRGARFAFVSETRSARRWDANSVKKLTSPEPTMARGIRENNVTWVPSHTLWIGTNNRPRVGAGEAAFFKRYQEVPFQYRWYKDTDAPALQRISVGPADPDLDAKFAEEFPGILNWMLAGLSKYWQAGGNGLPVPAAIAAANASARTESSLWSEFVAEAVIEDGCNGTEEISVKSLWTAWDAYRQENSKHEKVAPTTRRDMIRYFQNEVPASEFVPPKNNHETQRFIKVRFTDKGRAWASLDNKIARPGGKSGSAKSGTTVTPLFPAAAGTEGA